MVSCIFNLKYIGQIAHLGGVLKLSEPADSKTDPGFENSPRFEGVTEQNKIQRTYDHDCIIWIIFSALCELFDKADTGGDGTISIPEYIAMCDEYGIDITDEHIDSVKAIANENGEVRNKIPIFSFIGYLSIG